MKKLLLTISVVFLALSLSAQDKGYLTGSFETNTNVYHDDDVTKATAPEGNFGSNNYLKLDYHKGGFAAGIQMEGYLPAAVGYPDELSGFDLSNIYAQWQDEDFSITAGTFYDQFGSGLLFRSWEDRALGLNNAVLGARFTYNFQDILAFKAMWGLPRFGMGVFSVNTEEQKNQTNTGTQVRGADLSFVISNLCKWNSLFLSLEASLLNRYSPISSDLLDEGGKANTFGYSARVNMEKDGFFLKGEYVDGGKKYFFNNVDYSNPAIYLQKNANAQLLELGYNGKGLGVTLTGRRLEWMSSQIVNSDSPSNLMNYIPAMCTQYTYMLTTLHPYSPETGLLQNGFTNSGELGGQIDAFYNFRRGTALGGKRGMKVHANFSTYYSIADEGTFRSGNMLFRDFSFDIEKQWTKEFKMVLLYSLQQYNDSHGARKDYMTQNVFVADLLYKFTKTISARMELQYLQTRQDKKDWMAALLEVNFAPRWSIYASDMFNHGRTKAHYYNFGVSYAKSRTRVALGYGRYRAGFICSGGVCRTIPAYTGANLSVTTSF